VLVILLLVLLILLLVLLILLLVLVYNIFIQKFSEASDALALSNALQSSQTSGSNGVEALDLPFGQQYSSWMSSSNVVVSPNPTFQRRLKQLSRQTLRGRGNSSLPSTPRANMFFPMNMPLDVGINSLLCGLNSPDEAKAIIRVNTVKFDKQLQAFGLEVMKSQSEQSLRSVSELDAKCLVKLVSTHYAQQDEELFMKLITAIANCSTFTNNQVRKFMDWKDYGLTVSSFSFDRTP
jgi:type II secretory pathway pseudopilin PulG